MKLRGLGKGRRYVMTCKDCVHYEVCKRIDYELEYHNKSIKEAEELPTKCRFFKNKADTIDIPDDTIMYIQDKWLVINTESGQLGEAIKCLFRQFNQ